MAVPSEASAHVASVKLSKDPVGGVHAGVQQIVVSISPLQSLTIWDGKSEDEPEEILSARKRFLPRFRIGLEAEKDARAAIEAKEKEHIAEIMKKTYDRKPSSGADYKISALVAHY